LAAPTAAANSASTASRAVDDFNIMHKAEWPQAAAIELGSCHAPVVTHVRAAALQ
jgi:hypothetical protein